MIEIDSINKAFGSEEVLRNLFLRLNEGDFAALIGSSGAGKTVLARCIIGLEAIDSGQIRIDGLSFDAGLSPDSARWIPARKTVALVTQNRALPPYRTVFDQVTEGPRYVLGMKTADALERSMPWIERLGLREHLKKYPNELSGGQLARLCLARAVVMNPSYLICDEVSANLDPFIAAEVARSLIEVATTGMGILFISHQTEFIRRYASVLHFLHNGSIVCSGDPKLFLSDPPNETLRHYLRGIDLGR
jgi:ABC-type polar amino acid transport system ATPase subunit